MIPDILKDKKLAELREIASALNIENADKMKKSEILNLLTNMHEQAKANGEIEESPKASVQVEEQIKIAETDKKESTVKAKSNKKKTDVSKKDQAGKAHKKSNKKAEENNQPEEAKADEVLEEKENNNSEIETEQVQYAVSDKVQDETTDETAEELKPGRYETTGILDLAEGGFGFLRFDNFLTSDADVYVSPTQIRRFNLKTGDEICGVARKPGAGEKFGALLFVKTVNGDEPGVAKNRKDFSALTPIYPDERIKLEKGSNVMSMRLVDLVAPIGKGQRGIIVAPPKAGKTTLLKQIAHAIENQNADAELIVLLVDERPEEVTDMQRSIKGKVIYSTFDEQPQHHVKVAEMVLARAQRLVEHGKDVIILLDSITRLARAYNLVEPSSGRTLSGGLDPAALYKPKKFFGAARNMEEGGSITILATALVETGSRMDDMIFEEFKGTGNMELHLDRKLQEKRIFPAINLNKSGTRKEDLLVSKEELEAMWLMRRAVADWGVAEATEKIVMDLLHTKTNQDFIQLFMKTRI